NDVASQPNDLPWCGSARFRVREGGQLEHLHAAAPELERTAWPTSDAAVAVGDVNGRSVPAHMPVKGGEGRRHRDRSLVLRSYGQRVRRQQGKRLREHLSA